MKDTIIKQIPTLKRYTFRKNSIRIRVFTLHTIILTLLFSFFLLSSLFLSKITAKNTLNTYGKLLLQNFSDNFDIESYSSFIENPTTENPNYEALSKSLVEFRKMVNATSVYTMKLNSEYQKIMMIDGSNEPLVPGYTLKNKASKTTINTIKRKKFISSQYTNNSQGEFYSFSYPLIGSKKEVLGLLVMDLDTTSLNKILIQNKYRINSFVFKFCFVLYLFSLIMTNLSISKLFYPIRSIQQFLSSISNGDLTKEFNYSENFDEFSSIQNLFIDVIENIKKILKSIIDTSKTVRNNFLTVEERKTNMINKISEINTLTSNISKSNEKIFLNTNNVKDEIFSFNSAINKMYTEISETKNISLKTQKICNENTENIECFISGISPLIQKFEHFKNNTLLLNNLSIEIKQILKEINEIANQTKLLSLNASIVASSSEEHGDNFSVVANEIGELSYKTSQSVSNIQDALATVIKTIYNINSETILTSEIFKEHAKKSTKFSNDLIKINNLISNTCSSLENISEKSKNLTEKNNSILASIKYINDESRSNNSILKAIYDSTNKLYQLSSYFKIEFKKISNYINNIQKEYRVFKTKKEN